MLPLAGLLIAQVSASLKWDWDALERAIEGTVIGAAIAGYFAILSFHSLPLTCGVRTPGALLPVVPYLTIVISLWVLLGVALGATIGVSSALVSDELSRRNAVRGATVGGLWGGITSGLIGVVANLLGTIYWHLRD